MSDVRIPFRIGPLDVATNGGIPQSKYSQIFGQSRTGKSETVMRAAISYQRMDPRDLLIISTGGKVDLEWWKHLGLDPKRVTVEPCDYLQVILDMILHTVKKEKDCGMIILDDLRSMPNKKTFENRNDTFVKPMNQFSPEAKDINNFLVGLGKFLNDRKEEGSPITLFIVNHEAMEPLPGGKSRVTQPRGQMQKFGSEVRVRMHKADLHGERSFAGQKFYAAVEFKYEVISQLGESGTKGAFFMQQMGNYRGRICDAPFWFRVGQEVGFIRKVDKKGKMQWIVGETMYEGEEKAVHEHFYNNLVEYFALQDTLLPLARDFLNTTFTFTPEISKRKVPTNSDVSEPPEDNDIPFPSEEDFA